MSIWKTIKKPQYLFTQRLGISAHHVFAAPMMRKILAEPEIFPKPVYLQKILQRNLGLGLLADNSPTWKPAHDHLVKMFAPDKIEVLFTNSMLQESQSLAKAWETKGTSINVEQDLRHLSAGIIGKAIFGEPVPELGIDIMVSATEKLANPNLSIPATLIFMTCKYMGLPLNPVGTMPASERRAAQELDKVIYPYTARRKEAESADPGNILDHLIAYRDETGQPLTDRRIRDHIVTFIAAGHETTATALTFAIRELTDQPYIANKIKAEVEEITNGAPLLPEQISKLHYTRNVFLETLRKHPPVFSMSREAMKHRVLEDTASGDIDIRKGDYVYFYIEKMHHNDDIWPEPEKFLPDRFTDKKNLREIFLPFSAGPRVCPGQSLAMTEGVTVLAQLCRSLQFTLEKDAEGKTRLFTLRPKGEILIGARPAPSPSGF